MKNFILSTLLILLSIHHVTAGEFTALREKCREDASKTWSSTRNRCVQKSEWASDLKNYRNCTDKPTKEERDECLYGLMKEVTGDLDFDDFNTASEAAMNAITAVVSAANLWMMRSSKYTPCTSLQMSAVCGGAAVAKDLYINYKGKKATEDIHKDFLERVKDQESYDTQVIAYQAQIDQLKSISGFYDQKATGHMIVGTCYLATVAVALYDAIQPASQSCLSQTSDGEGTELNEVEKDVDLKKGDKGFAEMEKIEGGETLIEIFSQEDGATGTFRQFTASRHALAVFNTLNFGWQMYLMNKSKEEANKANFMAKRLDIAKNQFVDGMSHYCPGGHENKDDLICYCYELGQKKSNRTNSKACQELWASKDRQLFVNSSDKQRLSEAKEKIGCVNVNGKFDPNCECRKFKDQKGNNACRKANFSTVGLGGFNKAINVAKLQDSLDKMNSGESSPGALNVSPKTLNAVGDTLKRKALANLKTKNKDGKLTPMSLSEFDKLGDSFVSRAENAINAGKDLSPFGKALSSTSKDAMKEISKKSPIGKRAKGLQMEGGNGIAAKKKKKNDDVVSFNMDSGGNSSVQNFKETNYMDRKYNTGNADINNKKDVSIFKILTNRYNKSGYRRLFEE